MIYLLSALRMDEPAKHTLSCEICFPATKFDGEMDTFALLAAKLASFVARTRQNDIARRSTRVAVRPGVPHSAPGIDLTTGFSDDWRIDEGTR
jgi:hypothetical protein